MHCGLLIRSVPTFFLQSHMEPFDGKFISATGMLSCLLVQF